jgi:hypothetical protein
MDPTSGSVHRGPTTNVEVGGFATGNQRRTCSRAPATPSGRAPLDTGQWPALSEGRDYQIAPSKLTMLAGGWAVEKAARG